MQNFTSSPKSTAISADSQPQGYKENLHLCKVREAWRGQWTSKPVRGGVIKGNGNYDKIANAHLSTCGMFFKIRHFLPINISICLHNAFSLPFLQYGILVRGLTYIYLLWKLISNQYFCCSKELYSQFHLRIRLHLLLLFSSTWKF